MPLNQDQIAQIKNYLSTCVEWYDVRMELVDHFALAIEEKLTANPNLDFKQAIIDTHKGFGGTGFKDLLKAKTKAVEKQFYKSAFKYFLGFFKIPRIILTVLIFLGLTEIMYLFEDKKIFFQILFSFILIVFIKLLIRSMKLKKSKGEKFLILNQGLNYSQMFNSFYIFFNLITDFRSISSFQKDTSNYLQLAFYTLLTLLYFSFESVYAHLKQGVKHQYPNLKLAQ